MLLEFHPTRYRFSTVIIFTRVSFRKTVNRCIEQKCSVCIYIYKNKICRKIRNLGTEINASLEIIQRGSHSIFNLTFPDIRRTNSLTFAQRCASKFKKHFHGKQSIPFTDLLFSAFYAQFPNSALLCPVSLVGQLFGVSFSSFCV